MGLQAMAALLPQKGGNEEVSILTPRVILQQPPILDVDVANDDAGNDTSRVSSEVSSADTSTGRGTRLIGQEMTVTGEVEGAEYPPLPDDYSLIIQRAVQTCVVGAMRRMVTMTMMTWKSN